jgi:hypothetical protein
MPELFSRVSTDDAGETRGLIARRVVMGLLAVIAILALLGFIGQPAATFGPTGSGARMTLSAPDAVRGGLMYQGRIDVRALAPIEHPRLVLDTGWFDGMQVSSIEPQADSESSRDGRVVLSYGALEPGDVLTVWLQFQVIPNVIGTRRQGVELDDAERPLARIDHSLRVLP